MSKITDMLTINHLYIVVFLLVGSTLFAQENHIEADRPDQTETPAIVPKKMFQFESGFLYEKTSSDAELLLTPTILSKYGVSDNFELRLITQFQSEHASGVDISGLAPVLVGFKVRLWDEKGPLPLTSFIGHLQLPNVASADLKASSLAPSFRFVMQHTLTEKLSLSYNLGAEWDGEMPSATLLYTVATGIELTDKLGMFAEFFGFAPETDAASHNFDTGFTYLLSNNAMIDVSGGIGLTENAPDTFASIGFSFRF